ncbi:hypothetical protein DJ528_11760, partial [Sulfolobus sp. B5]
WLRIMGYDAIYSNKYEDWKILEIAQNQNRIIITRDRSIYTKSLRRHLKCILLSPDSDIVKDLAYIAYKTRIDLSVNVNYTRCTECNSVLEKIGENKWICPRCKKNYWKGRHWRTIEEIIIKANSELLKLEEKHDIRRASNNTRTELRNRSNSNTDSKKVNLREV